MLNASKPKFDPHQSSRMLMQPSVSLIEVLKNTQKSLASRDQANSGQFGNFGSIYLHLISCLQVVNSRPKKGKRRPLKQTTKTPEHENEDP